LLRDKRQNIKRKEIRAHMPTIIDLSSLLRRMGAKNGKRMKGTDGLSGLPEDPGHCIPGFGTVQHQKGEYTNKAMEK
jgi:hypothetical protein